eukprot:symbB.v1.2.011063.t1/scaffold728.1/size168468/11
MRRQKDSTCEPWLWKRSTWEPGISLLQQLSEIWVLFMCSLKKQLAQCSAFRELWRFKRRSLETPIRR